MDLFTYNEVIASSNQTSGGRLPVKVKPLRSLQININILILIWIIAKIAIESQKTKIQSLLLVKFSYIPDTLSPAALQVTPGQVH